MGFQSVRDLSVAGKRVFLRADLNVPIKDGSVGDATRVEATLPTLDLLLKGGASVILASHLGRPAGTGFEEAFSMKPLAVWLKAKGYAVTLAPGVTGAAVEDAAKALQAGQVLLLENLRFDKGETKNTPEFAAALAKLAEVYVDDAFGAAHRAHASVAGMVADFPKGSVAAGLLMEREINALGRVVHNPEQPLVVIFGGSKVSDKIELIRNFLGKAQSILIGGAMSYTFLKAMGVPIGASLCEQDKLELAASLLKEAEAKGTKLMLPVDHVAAETFSADSPCVVTDGQAVPEGKMGLDIGPETVALYADEIRSAKTLLWNGPMGVFEMAPFASGTLSIADELARAADGGAFVLVGGGDSVAAVNQAGLADRMSHVSTGGGASLEFLSGLTLPGIAALDR
jgi:phosphoglycerate kinase